ncbi:QRFP-like peptide receptor [Oculina patagonica]
MNNSTLIDRIEYPSCPYAVFISITTAMAIISSAAFIGNILVISTVYKTPSLRRSTNFFYVNMAVSDFLSSLTTWPLYFIEEMRKGSESLLLGPLPTVSCKVGLYFRIMSYTVSILSLVLIAVERFIAIVFPFKATLITPKVRAALLFATWLIPIAHCIPLLFCSTLEEVGPETFCRAVDCNSLAMFIYYTTSAAIYTVVPLTAIIIFYSRIMHALKTRQQPESNDTNDANSQAKRRTQTKNVMKIFKSVVVAYFVCISLFGIYLVLEMTLLKLHSIDKCKFIRGLFNFLLPLLSTAINPVILFSLSTNFRNALQTLCPFSLGKCCSCCHVSLHQENISLPELIKYRQTLSR